MDSTASDATSSHSNIESNYRWRFITWGSILLAFLVFNLYSIVLMFRLNSRLGTIPENYKNIPSINRIEEACIQIHNDLVLGSTSRGSKGAPNYQKDVEEVKNSLQQYLINAPSLHLKLNEQLSQNISQFLELSEKCLGKQNSKGGAYRESPLKELGESLLSIHDTGAQIQKAYHTGSIDEVENSKRVIRFTSFFLFLATPIVVGLSMYTSSILRKSVEDPLRLFHASFRDFDSESTLKPSYFSGNDFGRLARSFHEVATQLRNYRENTTEQIYRLNRTVQTTLSSFPDPIFVLNLNGTVEFKNPAAEKFATKLLYEGQAGLPPIVDKHLCKVLETKTDYIPQKLQETISFKIDSEDRYYLPRVVLLRDEKENIFGVAIILEDVTNLRLLDDVKTNLISTVSHELKTPLTSIRMAIFLLIEQAGSLPSKQKELLNMAKNDLERLLHTLNNLLDLTWIEESNPKFNLEPCTPRDLVDTAISDVQDLLEQKSIHLTSSVDPHLPCLMIDKQRSSPILTNFLTNAVKHTPRNGEIEVRAVETRSGKIRLSVIDQGPGISKEHHQRIFEKFYRVPGQFKTGAGLGLSIAREITQAQGGKIGVISEPGRGSEFFVEFPAEKVEACKEADMAV